MEENRLISRGYFPKELPPAFNTESLDSNLSSVKTEWETLWNNVTTKQSGESKSDFQLRRNSFTSKYSSSQCTNYSISKGKLARRTLRIPNPLHFIKVCELISNNWSKIQSIYNDSEYSTSFPIMESRENKRAVRTSSKNVQDLRNQIIEKSINKLIQVKIDISQFYPTIYTHIISWCTIDKIKAKVLYKKSKEELQALIELGDQDAINYSFADRLDIAIRACQDKQSIGIPIGPDTSHIIAELIACKIDVVLKKELPHLDFTGCRYYDDYYFFVNTRDEADLVIKTLQKILNEYQLEINDKKVEVEEYPFPFENDWVTDLHRFEFKETNASNGLKHYFSLMWQIGQKHSSRTDWIFKYALKTFEFGTNKLPVSSWETFENLLLKSTLIQPAILDITTSILLSYKDRLNDSSKLKIKNLIDNVVQMHSSVNHNFEVSWALWLAKSFEIRINVDVANLVLKTNDTASILILLCLDKEMGLVDGTPNYSMIETQLKDDILMSENWMLAYESVLKGWLTSSEENLIDKNEFFKILKQKGISFFDCSRQIAFPNLEETSSIQNTAPDKYSDSSADENDDNQEMNNHFYFANLSIQEW